jgi:2-oxo-3-(phosphooxy)propyl 3-oxoalkanoate synthase
MTALINKRHSQTIGDLSDIGSQISRRGVTAHLVHRIHDRDVFVTSVRVVGPSHFEATAIWPARHPFYGPVGGLHDPMLLLETMREAGLAVAHGKYGIPRDSSCIVREKGFECYPAGLSVAGDEPAEVVIDITTTDIKRRGGTVSAMRFDFTAYRDGEPIGHASYQTSFASAAVYTRVRGAYREAKPALAVDTPPVRPVSVGRVDEIDVLLTDAPGTGGWHLRVDPTHPVIYDHVTDHVPGNAAVEAGRQAAYLVTGRPDAMVVGAGMSFSRYIEFDLPCLVYARQTDESTGRRTVAVTFTQNGDISAEGTFELLLPRPTGA